MNKKTLIGIAIILIIAVGIYFYTSSSGSSPSQGLLQAETSPEASAAAARVLTLLNQIKSLRIDRSLFSDPAYQTLRDYSVPIPAVGVGRSNPFAPLSGVSVSTTTRR